MFDLKPQDPTPVGAASAPRLAAPLVLTPDEIAAIAGGMGEILTESEGGGRTCGMQCPPPPPPPQS